MTSCMRSWTLRKEKKCVPIGETETPSWKGRTTGHTDEGWILKGIDRLGECVANVEGILQGILQGTDE